MSDSTKVTRQELVAIFAVALMAFVGILVETSMNVTFPTLMKTMHVSLDLVQWITTGYLLTVALLMLTSAFLHQRFKNRQLFAVGASLFILGDLICALAPNFWVLLFGRVVQAGCAGLAIPLMFNVILETVPRARLGFYMGLAGLILMIAPASGPTFGGVMVALGSWRWIFWSTLPVEAIILLLGYGAIRQVSEVKRIHFDWSQFGLLAVAFISCTLGVNSMSTAGWLSWQFLGGLGLAIVAILGYLRLSKHSATPLLNLAIFKNPVFAFSFFAYVILQFCNIGINFALPNYAQIVVGAGSLIGGLMLLPGSLITAICQPWFGHLLDAHGARLPILMGNGLFVLAALGFTVLGQHLSIIVILMLYIVFSIGRSMAFSNTMTNGLKEVTMAERADANAIYNTGQQFAGSLGTTILAALMSSVKSGQLSAARETAMGSQLAFGLVLVLGLINFVLYRFVFKYQVTDK
ncbi:MFS transporter [Lactiplantibacillus pentosus]|uniref:MFS transporter n=3 Tax=Lactiplantibacillus pentosus TaxID=1589 RepID=A0AB37RHL4_LACPE|nr:MFS transporter [Lactiplantibacillus pentosus]CCC17376.1 permease of the major facilitator superfamily [Lactiplantibacillus pentosus IG1]MCT3283315.1 MFS transporter [Lactiplantibacillus pentosus]MCT3303308.1 MFS transporter [Lactiplantibacillus pentosus]PRO80787.1 MFS transporter [Lactiplantibacillus pentosus]